MKRPPFILLLIIVMMFGVIVVPASAQVTMTFRDMSLIGYQNFKIYEVNESGTYDLGLYNSTSDAVLLAQEENRSYAFVLQYVPSTTDYLSKPLKPVESFFDYTNTHYPDLLFLLFLACLLATAVYLARRGG